MELSRYQRLVLANQFMMLAKLYPEQAKSFEGMQEVVTNGYELQYDWIMDHILDDTLREDECNEVLEILRMFDALKRSYEDLSDKSGIQEWRIKFSGFSGNDHQEAKYLGYVRYLVEYEEMYTHLDRGDYYNSHMPILDFYRRMMSEWRRSANVDSLTREDLLRITSVWETKAEVS